MLKDAIDFSAVRRVLVIKLRHHGDVLLTSPVLTVLKNHVPGIEVDALVYHDTREMLSDHPALDRLFTIDRRWKALGPVGQLRAEWAVLRALRARQYDLVIHLTNHKRGAWLTRWLRPRWAVAPAGPFGKFFARSFTHRYAVVGGNRRHTVETHLDALRRLGLQPLPQERRLVFVADAAARSRVEGLLQAQGVWPGGYLLVHPNSRWMFKTWPTERMAAFIDLLTARGIPVVLTAAPSAEEMQCVEGILARLARPVVSLAGQLSLKELGAAIASARLFVGMDSVPMHLAAATGVPTVALFGPSGEVEWGPWQVPHRILTQPFSCRPCGKDGCGGGKRSECIDTIVPEAVLAACEALWPDGEEA